MSLTLRAYGTGATVSDAGSIEHTHRAIVFAASLLWRERGPLPTMQRAIRLREKVLSSQASSSRCTCPLRRTEGRSCQRRVWGEQSFSVRGGKTR
jgi:hypothetical protein